ncbi:hypothetical protein Pan97_23270 [Bremerella volcania]|uniref:Uncharacterized protein n=1 Tax=Bremerella volcania TaxID=2527984 RepID=A0A518C7U0_9BACT|nr:hypothetical protein [Bremerella volcania]QDU75297.1 hypothetical protein Pan97_23270 [Bremerella volcania]
MSQAHAPSDPCGSFPKGNAPQVVVRAGKTFVCSACGTLVEIPADVVGQLVITVGPPPPDPPDAELASRENQTLAQTSRSTSQCKKTRPPQPRRPQQPAPTAFAGEIIDRLRVPSAKQLDRAFGWVSFHLQVLDRQGSEIKRLRNLLKQRRVPCPRPRGHVDEVAVQAPVAPSPQQQARYAHEDVSMAPAIDNAKERGPP